jgi:hypothetical protein
MIVSFQPKEEWTAADEKAAASTSSHVYGKANFRNLFQVPYRRQQVDGPC